MILDLDRTPAGRSGLDITGELSLNLSGGGPDGVRLSGNLTVDNLEHRFLVRGELQAQGVAECGRCLAEFALVFAVPVEIVVLRGVDDDEGDGDNLVIHQRAGEVDLRAALREAAILAAPLVKVCHPDCQGLCAQCGAELNQGPCGCAAAAGDPRWSGLPDE